MNFEKIKRLRHLKVIISEAIMVLVVIATVIILALVVSGYWVNSDFKVERQGMLQISSTPTGASVIIDNETSWLQRTNTSKVLTGGEHEVILTKEGYDTWSKTVDISEGLLYRLHYPRLFILNRTPEKYYYLPEATFAAVSPDYDLLLVANNTTSWQLINLIEDEPKPRIIDVSNLFRSSGSTNGLFDGSIVRADWDHDEVHVLLEVNMGSSVEWVLLDVREPQRSINLSYEFGSEFSDVQIFDNSASNLLAIQNGNLHRIDVPNRSLSAVLVENVVDYDINNGEIVYVVEQHVDSSLPSYGIGLTKIGDKAKMPILEFTEPVMATQTKFYDNQFLVVSHGNTITLYDKANLNEAAEYILSFNPSSIKAGHHGEFIIVSSEAQLATIDMESSSVYEWVMENSSYQWLNHDMLYDVSGGELFVYDYDGLNRRNLSNNVSDHFPVTITRDKWLYYFSDDYLTREWLIEH